MEYESNFLSLIKKSMICVGTWPLNLSVYANYVYRMYHGILLAYFTTFIVTMIIGMKDIVYESSEKQAYAMQYSFTYIFVLWKAILCQKVSIRRLMKIISEKERFIFNSNDNGLKTVYKSCLKVNSTIFYVVFWAFVTILFLFAVVTYFEVKSWPTPSETSNFTVTDRELPLPQAMPFDIEQYFNLVFGFQVSSRIFAAFVFLGCETLLNSLIYFPAAYLKVLGYKFQQFGNATNTSINLETYLGSLILEHKEMIKYVIHLNSVLKWLLSIDFLLRSYHISFSLMGIMSLLENPVFNMDFIITLSFNLTYLVLIFLQMSCLYYSCNELILESQEMGNNIFYSNWYGQPLAIKQSLLIITMRSQKPLDLRIGNLYPISNDLIVGFAKAGLTYILISRLDF